ncbi:MAG TPA: chorismate mutase [Bryobacteraceae bacterium]|nr:chorismate mutase [Bryobacteraceae bacterium]
MTKTTLSPEEIQRVLAENRAKIDIIDTRLVDLLNQRAAAVQEIGQAKDAAKMAIYEPKREDDVYRNVQAANAGPLSGEALKRVFERIIDEMRTLQKQRRAAEQNARRGDS